MKNLTIELNEYKIRVDKLIEFMNEKKLELIILTQNTDIFYYSGSIQPSYVFISVNGEKSALARKSIERSKEEICNMPVDSFKNTDDLMAILKNRNFLSSKKIGFTMDVTAYSTIIRLIKLFDAAEPVDISMDIRLIRMAKSESEIEKLKHSAELLTAIPDIAAKNYREGMTELEMNAIIENYCRLNQHSGLIRFRKEGVEVNGSGVCSSGKNSLASGKFEGICIGRGISPAVPYGAANTVIEKNSLIILDYAYVFEGYHTDMTRILYTGNPPQEVIDAYNVMRNIEKEVVEILKCGVVCEDVYAVAAELAKKSGFEKNFMGTGLEKVYFVGHGVGLELNEPPYFAPKMKYTLPENTVVAIEPKIAHQVYGVIGIENTYLIEKDRATLLTTCNDEIFIC